VGLYRGLCEWLSVATALLACCVVVYRGGVDGFALGWLCNVVIGGLACCVGIRWLAQLVRCIGGLGRGGHSRF
jgi:hypothetical protein